MKKPLLALAGVAGACAACCAVPLALPLFAGVGAGGLAGTDWRLPGVDGLTAVMVGVAAAGLVGGWIAWRRRRAPASCSVSPGGCGCSSRAADRST